MGSGAARNNPRHHLYHPCELNGATGPVPAFVLRDFRAKVRFNRDSWQGQVARHGEAQAWCLAKGYQQTKKFPMTLGDASAKTLCQAWAARMQFLFESEKQGLFDSEALKVATMNTFVESDAFQELMEHGTDADIAFGVGIRALLPK